MTVESMMQGYPPQVGVGKKDRKVHAKRQGKPCRNCGGTERYGGSYNCVACTDRRGKERRLSGLRREQEKIWKLKATYNLSPEQKENIFAGQGYRCSVCSSDTPNHKTGWRIDHDHRTGQIRGILCHACNLGIGWFRDSPERMALAIEYLKRFSKEPSI